CQNIRQISNASSPPRFRLMMSDGQHSLTSCLLATQLNYLSEENLLVPNCVCLLKKTINNTLADGRYVLTLYFLSSFVYSCFPIWYNFHFAPFFCSRRVVVVMDMDILKSAKETGGKIGNPTPYNTDGKTSSPQKVSSSTYVPESPPSAAVPGPSYRNYSCEFFCQTLLIYQSLINTDSFLFFFHRWTIRARVTNKSSIRTWSNSRGEGKLFSFEIVDESGEIRITAFNKEVDKFFSLVEQGKVYYISKATLKPANKQYTTLKNDYEMTLHAYSSIVPCDDNQSIPTVHCDFVPIAELENRDKDAIIDVIGICKSAEDVSRITTKNSREVSKRALSIIDETGKVVTVTLWGEEAENFDGSTQPVVAIKGARLSDFGGRSLSALFSSTVMVNPDIPQAFRLRAWYDREGFAVNSQSLTETRSAGTGLNMNWKTLSDIKNEDMGHGEKAQYFSCVATVLYIRKENCLYQACPSADCNKKVIDQQNGLYRCEKCNKEFPNFKYRLLLSANLADFGDNQWVTCFQETAEALHIAAFDEVFQKANFTTHIFKNRVKLETYNDESRVKVTVMEVQPVDHREYSRRLLQNIYKLAR
uniref:Replication protein A subunit n=1 Tax=Astatotilapia calliptera TaxID=8154 RepID=A0AAX7SV82_ASTCA